MSPVDRRRRSRCAGFSLVEMLLASAIFAIVAAVAFIFYTAAQESFKAGGNFADQQQATRVGFDRMISDIRLAGFNTNPDGDSSRVDEQVEGAWDTAVTIRGDFDFEDPAASATPESALPGSVYNLVSTGNDEIVTYVLAKPGPFGPASLTILVDPDKPRSKTLKPIIIPNVALVQNDPPYTLYRVTLKDIAGAYPSAPQAASDFIYEPVAENIRTMALRYFPDSGVQLGPDTPANPADDIGGLEAASVTRSKIRRISVSLVGMTPDEDLDYVDAGDASATTHYRKFDLQSDVNAENLGKSAVKDIDVTPPPAPTAVAVVPGHCKGMLVTWDTPSASSGVTAYGIKYWPNGSPSSFSTATVTYPHNEYGVIDYDGHGFVAGLTLGSSYCFQVQARDLMGNQSGWSPSGSPPCGTVAEASTPGQPQNFAATGNGSLSPQDSQITLTWDEVKANSDSVSGDPDTALGRTILRDPTGYKLYRDTTSGFAPNDATNLIAAPPALDNGVLTYTDTAVANCQDYHYKLVAVDTCDVTSAAGAQAVGRAWTNVAPAQPTGLTGSRTSPTSVSLSWNPVTTKVDGTSVFVNLYKVYRYKTSASASLESMPTVAFESRGVTSATTFNDSLDTLDQQDVEKGQSLYYAVTAADLCGNEGPRAGPVEVSCSFNGSLVVSPGDGDANGGMVLINLSVIGTDTYTRARVRIPDPGNPGAFVYDEASYSYPFSFPAWNTSGVGPGRYRIFWQVENGAGCVQSLMTSFEVTTALACQISPSQPDLSPANGKPTDQNRRLSWDVNNTAGKDLEITRIGVTWTSVLGTHKLLAIEWPEGSIVSDFGAGASSSIVGDYSILPLLLVIGSGSNCSGSSCVRMSMVWDTQIINSATLGELLTITYTFRDSSGSSGACSFSVKPDLSFE